MDAYDLPEPMLPSDDDEAMGDGTSYTTRQPEPCSDQEMDDGQAQTVTRKKRTAAAPRRKQAGLAEARRVAGPRLASAKMSDSAPRRLGASGLTRSRAILQVCKP